MKLSKIVNKKINEQHILRSFFVFDIETTKLEPVPRNFVFGVLYGFDFCKVIYSVEDFKKEFKKKKYKGKTIFAHNAEFDLLGIYGNIYKNLDRTALFNGKFIMAKSNGVTFADSLNILLGSVEKIGEKLGFKKDINEKIKEGKLTKINITKEDIDYCIKDCQIVYEALKPIFIEIGSIKITLSSISLADFRRNYLKKDIHFNELVYEFYDSYYGGRTEAFKIGYIKKSRMFDINSLYPSVMIDTYYPDVSKLVRVDKLNLKEFNTILNTMEGMANISVSHNDTYFGSLPYRFEGKLLFPVGCYTGTWNFNEIRYAISIGYIDILRVNYSIHSTPVKSPFNDFIKSLYRDRLNESNELKKYFIKIKMNSLYGRMGMRKKFKTEYFESIPLEILNSLQKQNKFYKLDIFSEVRQDCFLETENEKMKNSFFAIPTFASYITSYARIKLMEGLIANEKNNVSYCDTDSIALDGEFIGEVSDKLGAWKKEKKEIIEIRGLKNYTCIEEGVLSEVIKGVSKRATKVDNTYFTEKYYKTKQALRQSKEAGSSYTEKKTLTHTYNKRFILKNGNTKPIKF